MMLNNNYSNQLIYNGTWKTTISTTRFWRTQKVKR